MDVGFGAVALAVPGSVILRDRPTEMILAFHNVTESAGMWELGVWTQLGPGSASGCAHFPEEFWKFHEEFWKFREEICVLGLWSGFPGGYSIFSRHPRGCGDLIP